MFRFHLKLWLFQCRKSIHKTETYIFNWFSNINHPFWSTPILGNLHKVTRSFWKHFSLQAIETFTIKHPYIPCNHLIEHGFARIMSWVLQSCSGGHDKDTYHRVDDLDVVKIREAVVSQSRRNIMTFIFHSIIDYHLSYIILSNYCAISISFQFFPVNIGFQLPFYHVEAEPWWGIIRPMDLLNLKISRS